MDLEHVLLSLLIVLVAARVAAEAAERLGQPAVMGEIIAGILIGPSVLGLVHPTELLKLIGEIGVVLLLFEVGMQMDLKELGRVGQDSLRVAAIGIALPMILTLLILNALGVPSPIALFVAGALTATSVGITARVFGDLRALATPGARTVLGAAIADDIGGLLILTVVTALAAGGGVSAAALATTIAGALGFVLFATAGAVWAAPRLFRQISGRARTEGTLMGLAFAFALALALGASAVHLAPIIGAFIAGLAISRSEARDEVQRRLVPLAHFFVPVFFLLIGIQTRLDVLARPSVIGIAAALCVAALLGKIASGLGVRRGRASRLLVGVAMVPRGEVGLIFAGIGLSGGILDSRYYGVLVAVVLVTTLITPPWVRRLIQSARRREVALSSTIAEPEQGWLSIHPDTVELNAEPPDFLSGRLGLEAAVLCASRQPGSWLLQWLSSASPHEVQWDGPLRQRLFELLRHGNSRSWRFLQVTGLLDAWLPIIGAAAGDRRRDPFNLDPEADLRWELLDDLQDLVHHGDALDGNEGHKRFSRVWERLDTQDIVLLAALVQSAWAAPLSAAKARELSRILGLREEDESLLDFLIRERGLLPAAARRLDLGTEDSVFALTVHLGSREKTDALYVLAVAANAMEVWERERLDELFELVQAALAHPDGASDGADPLKLRMAATAEALSHLPERSVTSHLESAPIRYLIAQGPQVVAKHIDMTGTPFARHEIRLKAEPKEAPGEWVVHLAMQDRRGLLALISGVFASEGVQVEEAFVSTWRNGNAIDVFRVRAPIDTDWESLRESMMARLASGPNPEVGGIEGVVQIDNVASPWHTIVEIKALDRTGLLHRVASALWRANLHIHMAVVHTESDVAVDLFYVTGSKGGKLTETEERNLTSALSGAQPRLWRLPRWKRTRELEFTDK